MERAYPLGSNSAGSRAHGVNWRSAGGKDLGCEAAMYASHHEVIQRAPSLFLSPLRSKMELAPTCECTGARQNDGVGGVLPKAPPLISEVGGFHCAHASGVAQSAWQHRRLSARPSRYTVGCPYNIRLQIDVRRGRALVPEPQRDDGDIDSGLEQVHRRGVADRMWRDAPSRELRLRPGSAAHREAEPLDDAGSGQHCARAVREQGIVVASLFQVTSPLPHGGCGILPGWYAASLAALSTEVCHR